MTNRMTLELRSSSRQGRGNYFSNCLGLKGAFLLYRKAFDEIDMPDRGIQDSKVYIKVCKLANQKIMKRIIEDAELFVLPFGLGELRIKKKFIDKVLTNLVNWPLSKASGKIIYYSNDHSDGFLMKFYWDKYFGSVTNIQTYSFVASKTNKQWLGRTIKANPKIGYYE